MTQSSALTVQLNEFAIGVRLPEWSDVDFGAPPPVTQEHLYTRLELLRREQANAIHKKPGDPVAFGDALVVDMVGYCEGTIVPGSARLKQELLMAVDPTVSGLIEGLVGTVVGSSRVVPAALSDDFAIAEFRGRRASFAVSVHAARSMELPDPNSQSFLDAVGADTLENVFEILGMQSLLELRAAEMVRAMDTFVRASELTVPKAAIDEELRERWRAGEGKVLEVLGISGEDRKSALDAAVSNPTLRAEVEHQIAADVVKHAVATRDGIAPTHEEFNDIIGQLAETLGTTPEALRNSLASDEVERAALAGQAMFLKVGLHILSHLAHKADV